MENCGWPKPETWLRLQEDAESADLIAEEARVLEEAGLDMSSLPEGRVGPLGGKPPQFPGAFDFGQFFLGAGCLQPESAAGHDFELDHTISAS